MCTRKIILLSPTLMQVLRDANECHYADAGGFVSPSGLSYIGTLRLLRARCHSCTMLGRIKVGGFSQTPNRSPTYMQNMHICNLAL